MNSERILIEFWFLLLFHSINGKEKYVPSRDAGEGGHAQFWAEPLNLKPIPGGQIILAHHGRCGVSALFFGIRIKAHETDFSLQNGALQFMF